MERDWSLIAQASALAAEKPLASLGSAGPPDERRRPTSEYEAA